MEIKRAAALYFSPTGGTRRIASRLAAALCPGAEELDVTVHPAAREFAADELAVIAAPVFGGRVPALSVERLRGITAHGTPAVVVAVYGNRAYEDALLELCDAAAERGFRVIAAGAFIARHSIVPDIAAGRPDSADFAALERFAAAVREKLAAAPAAEALSAVTPPGSRPYREFGGVPMHPSAPKSKCGQCGKCAAECPTGAIDPAAPEKTDGGKCITCMRCVAVCPHYARRLNPAMLAATSVKLKKACAARREPEFYL